MRNAGVLEVVDLAHLNANKSHGSQAGASYMPVAAKLCQV